jgi:hypothetical protein
MVQSDILKRKTRIRWGSFTGVVVFVRNETEVVIVLDDRKGCIMCTPSGRIITPSNLWPSYDGAVTKRRRGINDK